MRCLNRLVTCALLSLAACAANGGSDGSGALRVAISGEAAARSGYPVASGKSEIAFTDGWTLAFEKVLASVSDLRLQSRDGDDAALHAGSVVADLHLGEPTLWSFDDVPARRWDRVGYRYAPPTADSEKADDVDDADVQRMADNGYSLYIEATAEKAARRVPLAFGFAFEVEMSDCENGADGTDGLVVANNARNVAQITVHLDHLFFDSFAIDDAALRFDAMAAVAPADGPLTLPDLARQDNLSDLLGTDGKPLELAYDPGSAFDPVPRDLEAYVIAAGATTGHWNGEGHCSYRRK